MTDAAEDIAKVIVDVATGKIPESSSGVIADILALGRSLLQERDRGRNPDVYARRSELVSPLEGDEP